MNGLDLISWNYWPNHASPFSSIVCILLQQSIFSYYTLLVVATFVSVVFFLCNPALQILKPLLLQYLHFAVTKSKKIKHSTIIYCSVLKKADVIACFLQQSLLWLESKNSSEITRYRYFFSFLIWKSQFSCGWARLKRCPFSFIKNSSYLSHGFA